MPSRILFVDDDPDIRAVVELALGLDPELTVTICDNGIDALAISAEWAPALILCDVMMPGLDGPTMLKRLRDTPKTANIPVVFMTARAQANEIEQLKSLGAAAVFTKPFDPMTLTARVREQLCSAELDAARSHFIERMRTDAATLAECRKLLCNGFGPSVLTDSFQSCVHKLSGAAGVFDFQTVSSKAAALENAIIERRTGGGDPGMLEADLDALLECIQHESMSSPLAGGPYASLARNRASQAGDQYDEHG
jgi:CheY-like chemotaxis protein